jgi:hypothetical protein
MFTATKHTLLFCTVSRADVDTLKSTVLAVDPDAFVVIGHGHEGIGGVVRHATQEHLSHGSPSQDEEEYITDSTSHTEE